MEALPQTLMRELEVHLNMDSLSSPSPSPLLYLLVHLQMNEVIRYLNVHSFLELIRHLIGNYMFRM